MSMYGLSRLPYPLSYLTRNTYVVPSSSGGGQPALNQNGTRTYIITMTDVQVRRFSSALTAGADLIYPDDWPDVIAPWLESRTMDICDAVANCILTSDAVRDALRDVSAGTPDTPALYNAAPVLLSNCDKDLLFGQITQLIDYANTLIVDFLETVTASGNAAEQIALMLSAIPIVETLPFDEVFEFGVIVIDNFEQNYNAAYTSSLRDEYRCDLFCLVGDSCDLGFDVLADYFANKSLTTIASVDFADFIEFVFQGTLSGAEVVHAMHAILFGAMAFASRFLGVDYNRFKAVVSAFGNDADSDWSVLCVPCSFDWEHTFDFLIDEQGWQVTTPGYAVYDPGVGWRTNYAGGFNRCQVDVAFARAELVEVVATYDFTRGGTNQVFVAIYDAGSNVGQDRNNNEPDGTNSEKRVSATVYGDRILFYAVPGSSPGAGECVLRRVIVRGKGTNPF